MTPSDVIDILRRSIQQQKEQGATSLAIDSLEFALAELSKMAAQSVNGAPAPEAALEQYKATLAGHLDHQKRVHEHSLEMLRAVIAVGQSALKGVLLINGGATVALLAFLGHIWSSDGGAKTVATLSTPLLIYAMGVLSAGLAGAATYGGQAGYAGDFGKRSRSIGVVCHAAAISCALFAFALFGWATVKTALAFKFLAV